MTTTATRPAVRDESRLGRVMRSMPSCGTVMVAKVAPIDAEPEYSNLGNGLAVLPRPAWLGLGLGLERVRVRWGQG